MVIQFPFSLLETELCQTVVPETRAKTSESSLFFVSQENKNLSGYLNYLEKKMEL